MFAMCQPELPLNVLFSEAKGNSQLDTAYLGGRDGNLNFMGEEPYDSNENWNQPTSGSLEHMEAGQLGGSAPAASNNQIALMCKQEANGAPRNIHQEVKQESMFLASEEEEEEVDDDDDEEEDIRRPPEGAEVSSLEQEKVTVKERVKGSRKMASSPLEDNGYASSSLSIDSPDSGGAGPWETPSVAAEDWKESEAEDLSSSPEALFPALAEAFQSLQEKKKFKEQEKQKHRVHLVMYRRLALLRWIRSLQQKVVDQQNRLQESFDTILDNRKELIRCVQQGMPCPKNPVQAEL